MDQVEQIFENIGTLEPTGERFDFTVTGITRSPQDVVPHQKVPDVVYMGSAEVLLGPAFDAAHRGVDIPSLGALFGDAGPAGSLGPRAPRRLLRDDARGASPPRSRRSTPRRSSTSAPATRSGRPRRPAGRSGSRRRCSWPSARWWRSAGSCSSPRRCDASSRPTATCSARSRALGATRSSAVRRAAVKSALVGRRQCGRGRGRRHRRLPAHAGGARPSGRDRSGIDVDPIVLALGTLALVVLVVGFAAASAWRGVHGRAAGPIVERVCGSSDRAARAGMPPSVVAGVRAAGLGAGRIHGPRDRVRGGARDRRRPRLRRQRAAARHRPGALGLDASTPWSAMATTRPPSSGQRRSWPATR